MSSDLAPLTQHLQQELASALTALHKCSEQPSRESNSYWAMAKALTDMWTNAGYTLDKLELEYSTLEYDKPSAHPWYLALERNNNQKENLVSAHALIMSTRAWLAGRVGVPAVTKSELTGLELLGVQEEEKKRAKEMDKRIIFINVFGHHSSAESRLLSVAGKYDQHVLVSHIKPRKARSNPMQANKKDLFKLTFTRSGLKESFRKQFVFKEGRLDGHRVQALDISRFSKTDSNRVLTRELVVYNCIGSESDIRASFPNVKKVDLSPMNLEADLTFGSASEALKAFEDNKELKIGGLKAAVLFKRQQSLNMG